MHGRSSRHLHRVLSSQANEWNDVELDLPVDSISLRFSAELIRHTRDEFDTMKTFSISLCFEAFYGYEDPRKTFGTESSGVSEMRLVQ